MDERSSSWLVNCGIGCGVLLVILIGVGIVGAVYLKRSFQGITDATDAQEKLVEALGEPTDFAPAPDGVIPGDRMERFLAVRESLVEATQRIEELLSNFPPKELEEEGPVLGKIFSAVKGAASLINPIAEFVAQRNQTLLREEMGLGEYLYIYSLAYYSLLGHSPQDRPEISEVQGDSGVRVEIFNDKDSEYNPERLRRRYRRFIIPILENQLEVARQGQYPTEALESELGSLKKHPGRKAWQDGLPPAIEQSLLPFRNRLEATYNKTTNCFELPR
jgi:hypothetical protein